MALGRPWYFSTCVGLARGFLLPALLCCIALGLANSPALAGPEVPAGTVPTAGLQRLPGTAAFDSLRVLVGRFSPNRDDVQDEAVFEFFVADTSYVFVYVSRPSLGDTLAVVVNDTITSLGIANQGTWNGLNSQGVTQPSGTYDLVFHSEDDEGTVVDNQRSVTLDLVAPSVEILGLTDSYTPTIPGSPSDLTVDLRVTNATPDIDVLSVGLIDRPGGNLLANFRILGGFAGNGDYTASCDSCASAEIAPDGVYDVRVTVDDLAGNVTTATDSVDKNIDSPELLFTHPTAGLQFATQVPDSLTGSASDRQPISQLFLQISPLDTTIVPNLQVLGEATLFWLDVSGLFVSELTYGIDCVAIDTAGLADTLHMDYTVDLTAPAAPIFAPSLPASTLQANLDVTLLLGPETRSLLTSVNDVTDTINVAAGTDTLTFRDVPLQVGLNTLRYVAVDGAGNESIESVAVIQRGASGLSLVAPERFQSGGLIEIGTGSSNAIGVDVKLFALDGTLVQSFVRNAPQSVYTFSWDLTTPEGKRVKNGAYMIVAQIQLDPGGRRLLRKMISVIE